jgi:flagellar hook assembly protein FlgD
VGVPGEVPAARALLAAAPNPSAGAARLTFTLPQAGPVRLRLFDLGGREVRALVEGAREAGTHTVAWDGRDARGNRVAAGVYFARLEAGGETLARRLVRLD